MRFSLNDTSFFVSVSMFISLFMCVTNFRDHFLLFFFFLLEKYRKVTDNPWFYVWVSDAVIFSIYAYAWDVRQDFDLWDCKAQVNTKCLRDDLIYESKVSKQTLSIYLIFISKEKRWCGWYLCVCVNDLKEKEKPYTYIHKRWYYCCWNWYRFAMFIYVVIRK